MTTRCSLGRCPSWWRTSGWPAPTRSAATSPRIHNAGGKYSFTFPAEQLEHAHDTLSGKFIHGNDIKENTGKKIANMQTEKYKARQAAYRAFITATVPEKG